MTHCSTHGTKSETQKKCKKNLTALIDLNKNKNKNSTADCSGYNALQKLNYLGYMQAAQPIYSDVITKQQ